MTLRSIAIAGVALVVAAFSHGVAAQSLGRAINGALAKEGKQIEQQATTTAIATPAGSSAQATPEQGNHIRVSGIVEMRLSRGDALAYVTAISCLQANGTTLRISGGYRPAAADSGKCHIDWARH